jgi:hypothetical protein
MLGSSSGDAYALHGELLVAMLIQESSRAGDIAKLDLIFFGPNSEWDSQGEAVKE